MRRRGLLRASGIGALAGLTTMAAAPAAAGSPPAQHPRSSWRMARELIADGPDPERAEAMQLYGQFIGSWDVTVSEHFPPQTYPAEWHFGWILHGRGVQDVFGQPSLNDHGTTVRIYDHTTDRWAVSWFGPSGAAGSAEPSIRHFQAEQVGDEVVQSGAEFEGSPMRWIFSDIGERHFHWRNEIFFDDAPDWIVVQEMDATRRWPIPRP